MLYSAEVDSMPILFQFLNSPHTLRLYLKPTLSTLQFCKKLKLFFIIIHFAIIVFLSHALASLSLCLPAFAQHALKHRYLLRIIGKREQSSIHKIYHKFSQGWQFFWNLFEFFQRFEPLKCMTCFLPLSWEWSV